MSARASQITSLTIVYSTVGSRADQRKHQSSASLAFVRGIYRWQVNSPHTRPVTRKMFSFGDVIMMNPTVSLIVADGQALFFGQSATIVPLVDLDSWWPLTWPNHPFSLGGNSCVPPQRNIILMFQKEKRQSPSDLITKIHKSLSIQICGCWQIKSDLRKFPYQETGVCEEITANRPNSDRDFRLGDCFSASVHLHPLWWQGPAGVFHEYST